MFKTLILRSLEDFRMLDTLWLVPASAHLSPIVNYLIHLVIDYRLSDYPWFHGVHQYLVEWTRQTGKQSRILDIHVSGATTTSGDVAPYCTVQHPLFRTSLNLPLCPTST